MKKIKPRAKKGSLLHKDPEKAKAVQRPHRALSFLSHIIAIALLVLAYLFIGGYFTSILAALSVIFILSTIIIQVERYRGDKSKENLFPLIGYLFLFVFAIAFAIYRLPTLEILFFRELTLEYSQIWYVMLFASFFGFLFLALWAWNYIKVREFLRTYVLFLAVTIFISCLGSLLFTLFVFNIVEENNLKLMSQGAKTQQLILSERADAALFVARTVANDSYLVDKLSTSKASELSGVAFWYYDTADLDALFVYNEFGEIVASPSDPRDLGKMMNEDDLVAFAIKEKKQIKSFDKMPGVLSPVIIARAVMPIIKDDKVIGAVEARHTFDNAFVDFSKGRTGLDTEIFTKDKRSATTIWTEDGVSRWLGSSIDDQTTYETVLLNGQSYRTIADRLGVTYYSAYEPVRNINGDIIGMVSVGIPSDVLLEETRQELLTTFLALAIISSLIALLGYYTVHIFYTKRS
ncbi:MAG: cache domain-containing protein [Patescibacteria group bacterium]